VALRVVYEVAQVVSIPDRRHRRRDPLADVSIHGLWRGGVQVGTAILRRPELPSRLGTSCGRNAWRAGFRPARRSSATALAKARRGTVGEGGGVQAVSGKRRDRPWPKEAA